MVKKVFSKMTHFNPVSLAILGWLAFVGGLKELDPGDKLDAILIRKVSI
jgi:hypothetical protein